MERTELIRERHRPDWLPIFLGMTIDFAVMGCLAILGESLRLLRFNPSDSIGFLVIKLVWLLGSVSSATYIGGFITGLTMSGRSRVAAALNGLIVAQFTIVLFFVIAFFGDSPLPGVIFSWSPDGQSEDGLIWWAMMITLPNIFASIFGAMHGNDFVRRRDPVEAEVMPFKEEAPTVTERRKAA